MFYSSFSRIRSLLLAFLIFLLPPLAVPSANSELPARPSEAGSFEPPIPGGKLMMVGLERFKNWSRVRAFLLDPRNGRQAGLRPWVAWARTLRPLPVYDRLAAIDARVGAKIAYATDDVVWHRADYWENPLEVVRKGRTDCEGYVALKMFLAAVAGIDHERMAIVVGRVPDLGIFHAVLVVRVGAARYALDNLRPGLTEIGERADFEPIYAVDMIHAWSFPSWERERLLGAIQQLQAMKPAEGQGMQ